MNNATQKSVEYQTVSGKILPPCFEGGLQKSPLLAEVIDNVESIRWRWNRENVTKTILGFAIEMNPHLISIEHIEESITTMIMQAFVSHSEELDKNTLNLYLGGLQRSGASDGYPLTLYAKIDADRLFSPPPDYDCRARREYLNNHLMESHRQLLAKYKDLELSNKEKPRFK
jgi:hypothetical protein